MTTPGADTPPPALAVQSSDGGTDRLAQLLGSVNAASSAARNAWLAFMGLLAFYFVTISSVTHQDLLLNSPVKLPILGVELPLNGFFVWGPVVFLLVHFSILLQHMMLARKLRMFDLRCAATETGPNAGPNILRDELNTYFFTQSRAGAKSQHPYHMTLDAMGWITFIVLPLCLLFYFQISFLAYHSVSVTWWHRLTLIADMVVLAWIFALSHDPVRLSTTEKRLLVQLVLLAFAGALLLFSLFVATVPDSVLDRAMRALPFAAPVPYGRPDLTRDTGRMAFWPTAVLFEGALLARNLSVTDTDLVKDKDFPLKGGGLSLRLRERNLKYATLDRSDLHLADLTGAQLQGARLVETVLNKAKLSCAQPNATDVRTRKCTNLQGADLRVARLQGANLQHVRLQGADLREARLEGADLRWAQLQGANLMWARLQGASLLGARLEGADLREARLEGANLQHTRLPGADLRAARLRGADLRWARLQGADLRHARLEGADLQGVWSQGADLEWAQLRGANLRHAGLQGADLRHAGLQVANLSLAGLEGADLRWALVWLTRPFEPTRASLANYDSLIVTDISNEAREYLSDQVESLRKLKAAMTADNIPGQERVAAAFERFKARLAPLLEGAPNRAWETVGRPTWSLLTRNAKQPDPDELACYLARDLACRDDTQKGYLAQALIGRVLETKRAPFAFYAPFKTCAARKNIPEELWAKLAAAAKAEFARRKVQSKTRSNALTKIGDIENPCTAFATPQ